MNSNKEWPCWVLSTGDIVGVSTVMGIEQEAFGEDEFNEIARRFKKGLEWAMDDWEMLLEEAIKIVRGEQNDTERN